MLITVLLNIFLKTLIHNNLNVLELVRNTFIQQGCIKLIKSDIKVL